MASLTGQTVSSTYDGLLKTEDNDILGANSKKITDGLGNETGLSLNTDGDVEISGDLKVDGAVIDSNGVSGTSGQILSSTGVGTDWVDLSEISGVDGTGTANNVTKWLDADTVTNSIMTDNGSAINVGGNITLTGTVDGRDVATDGSKLDGIEAGAQVNTVDSVNGNTGTVVLDSDDIAEGVTNLYDKTVTLTEGDNVTITGTYPNFTISSNDVVGEVSSVNAGSGISVDSTTGNVTVTNDAPNATHTGEVTGATALTITDGVITNAKMAANSVDSDQYVDGSIDTVHLADDSVTYAKLGTEFTTTAVVSASTIDFSTAQIFTKTLTGTTVFTYSNTQIGMVKDLIINADGNSFTLPTGTKIIAGTPTTGINFVQVVVTAAGEYWTSISQQQ